MKTYIIICLGILLSLNACKKEFCCAALSTSIYLEIVNSNGLDLLDPSSINNINFDNTELYYIIDGKKERQFHTNYDNPKMFRIEKQMEHYVIKLPLNPNPDIDGISISILEFKGYSADTVKARVHKTDNSTYISDVWINDKQVIDVQAKIGISGPIKIIK